MIIFKKPPYMIGRKIENTGFLYEETVLYLPSYAKFKGLESQSEENCVSVLLGIENINIFYTLFKKRYEKIYRPYHDSAVKMLNTKFDAFITPPGYPELAKEAIYLRKINFIFIEIQLMIQTGIKDRDNEGVPKIGKYKEGQFINDPTHADLYPPESLYDISLSPFKRFDRHFNGLSFLHWAKRNGYIIPDELRFYKDDNGVLKWNKEKSTPQNMNISLSNDSNLNWNNITVTFLNNHELLFQFQDKGKTRSFERLGFKNNKNNKPINSWGILLMSSQKGGVLPYNPESRATVEKQAQLIRAKFRALFPGISGDPIPLDKINHSYNFKFHLKNSIL